MDRPGAARPAAAGGLGDEPDARVLLVGLDREASRVLREGVALAGERAVVVPRADAALALVDSPGRSYDVAVLSDALEDPIALAQELQARDGELAVAIVSGPERLDELKRALRFAPLVTPNTHLRALEELDRLGAELGEAAKAARDRRRRAADLRAASQTFERPEPPAPTLSGSGYLGRLVEAAPIGFVTLDAGGRLAAWNRHAAQTLGLGRGAAGRPLGELVDPAEREALEAFLRDAGPSEAPATYTVARSAGGGEQHVRLSAGRFAASDGEPGTVLLVEDVTAQVVAEHERRRSEEAQRFLAETARLLDAPLEPVAMLQRIATLAVPDRAELCVIDLLEADGSVRGVAVASIDEEIARALQTVRDEHPIDPAGNHPVARVLRTGRSEVLEELTDETYRQIAQGGVHLALMRRLHYHSAVVAPLVARGRTHGAISLLYLDRDRRYSDEDIAVLEEVARRAAAALDNARLYEREHRIAETLQRSLLPDRLPRVPGIEMRARYEPGEGDVGGDWYDVVALPDGRVACVVGDIVGRGIEAASLMGQLRNAVRVYALEHGNATAVVNRLDTLIQTLGVSEMATLLYLVFDPESGRVELSSAGHPPALAVAPDGSSRYLMQGRSGPLGVGLGGSHVAASETLPPGSLLVLYTDGLVERRGEVIDDGLERLARAVREGPAPLDALAGHLLDSLLPGPRSDDVALLLLRTEEANVRLAVELPAEPQNVATVRRRLRQWLVHHKVPQDDAYDIVVAVGEACANAAEHAYGLAPGPLELEARIEDGGVELAVRDRGRWRSESPRGRGLGMQLMEEAMDEVDVSSSDEGTEVRMRRRLRETEGAEAAPSGEPAQPGEGANGGSPPADRAS